MGMDIEVRALIGVRIPHSKAFTVRKVRAFVHDFPDDWKVDPKTGKDLWRFATVNVANDLIREADPNVGVFTDGSNEEPRDVFVSRVYTASVEAKFGESYQNNIRAGSDVVNGEIEALRALLEPHGFWDGSEFGLWVVTSVSC